MLNFFNNLSSIGVSGSLGLLAFVLAFVIVVFRIKKGLPPFENDLTEEDEYTDYIAANRNKEKERR